VRVNLTLLVLWGIAIFNIAQTVPQYPTANIAGLEDVSMKVRFIRWTRANQ
jgi:hypothetical protein